MQRRQRWHVQSACPGTGAQARFNGPEGLAVASDGTLYVADTGNGVIRRITSDGTVRTLKSGESGCGVCASGEILCASGCSALATAHNNCGACGQACRGEDVCVHGMCVLQARITRESMHDGAMHLTLWGAIGVTYRIQASSDLTAFLDIGSVTIGPGGTGSFIDVNAGRFSQRFYRAAL